MAFTLKTEQTDTVKVEQEKLQEIYEGMAENYDAYVGKANYQVPKWIAPHIKRFQAKSLQILDLGCGNGFISKLLHSQGVKGSYFGFDFSPQMLAHANKLEIFEGLYQADLSKGVPILENQVFDLILGFGFMEFISSPVTVLNDISRLLAPGGEAFISFEETGSENMTSGKLDDTFGFIKYHYDFETIKGFVKECQLTIISNRKGIGYTSPTTRIDVPYVFLRLKRSQ